MIELAQFIGVASRIYVTNQKQSIYTVMERVLHRACEFGAWGALIRVSERYRNEMIS